MKKTKFFTILVSSLLTLTACGGDDSTPTNSTGPVSVPTTTTPITTPITTTTTPITTPITTTTPVIDSTPSTSVPPTPVVPLPPADRIVVDTSAPKELGAATYEQAGLADFAKEMSVKIPNLSEEFTAEMARQYITEMVDSLFELGQIQESQAKALYKVFLSSPIFPDLLASFLVVTPEGNSPINDKGAIVELLLEVLPIIEAEQISAIIIGFVNTSEFESIYSSLPGFEEENAKEDTYLKYKQKAFDEVNSRRSNVLTSLIVPIARYLKGVAEKVETLTLKELTSIQTLLTTLMDNTATMATRINAFFGLATVSFRFLPSNESLSYLIERLISSSNELSSISTTISLIDNGKAWLDADESIAALSELITKPDILEKALLFCYSNQIIVTEDFIGKVLSFYDSLTGIGAASQPDMQSLYEVILTIQKDGELDNLDEFASLISIIIHSADPTISATLNVDVKTFVKTIIGTEFTDVDALATYINEAINSSADEEKTGGKFVELVSYAGLSAPVEGAPIASTELIKYLRYCNESSFDLLSFTNDSVSFASPTLETTLGGHFIDVTIKDRGDEYEVKLPYFIYPSEMNPVVPMNVHAVFSTTGDAIEKILVTFFNPDPSVQPTPITVTPENFDQAAAFNYEKFYVLHNGYFYRCIINSSEHPSV